MAIRLRKKIVHGREYWYAVESVRVNGKPITRHVAYLGKPEDMVRARARGLKAISSRTHGVVAALKNLADRLEIVQTIDRHASPRSAKAPASSPIASVGTTLLLAAIGRAAHPTSKRGFAQWAATTTIPRLFDVKVEKLTSAFFWDQMDRVSPRALRAMETEILARAVQQFGVGTDLLLYDTTNFFTYIASDNEHCELPQRGKSKQRRNDLRQLALALLVSRDGGVPLGSHLYRGNRNDVSVFSEAFGALREQLTAMALEVEAITFVYDKGNVSQANQARMEQFGYVTSLVPSHHRELLALEEADAERLADGTAVWRLRKELWGSERTVVMLISEKLRAGQRQGLDQYLGKGLLELERIRRKLLAAKRRRKRAAVEQAVADVCGAGQLKRTLVAEVVERETGYFDLRCHIDMARYEELCQHYFGRRLLVTNRHQWSTAEIVGAFRGQSHVERAFRTVKDPFHLALRPQYHWTDQKIRVHVFCCLLAYLLVSLMVRQLRQAGFKHSPRHLLDLLEQVRLAHYIEARGKGRPGRPAVMTRLEDCDEETMKLFRLFVPEETTS
jgi:transposase